MRPDFGIKRTTLDNGLVLECRYVAPGVTMDDIVRVFEAARKEAEPCDEFSANPSKWPNMRGLDAVTDLLVSAFVKNAT